MKKLNKILAAISTAALTFCVWGTQTQAEVVTNEQGVPILINAKTNKEFFEDLQQVLNHIKSRLVTDTTNTNLIRTSFLRKYSLDEKIKNGITPSEYYRYQFDDLASHSGNTTVNIALGYLYELLRQSSVNTKQIDNIWRLNLELRHLGIDQPVGELVFTLPEDRDQYYTPNLRWYLCQQWSTENNLSPRPTTFIDSLLTSPECVNMVKTDMYIDCPDVPYGKTITCARYYRHELLIGHTRILQNLISIAGKHIEDAELSTAFTSHYNLITDYNEFVKQYNK